MGFRFSGWQKQPDAKTLHDATDKTLSFVFGHTNYKTIGTGRTDAKVSASNYPLQLFINQIIDIDDFIESFNRNAPGDLKCLAVNSCSTKFAIINAPKIKTYHYYFSFGEKQHPYGAPFMVGFLQDLDIDKMQKTAQLFEGKHHFKKYCCRPSAHTQFERTITECCIVKNEILTANFFPKNTYVLIIKGEGFLRYQIRYIMAVLAKVGNNEISLDEVKQSLSPNNDGKQWDFIAPSSGLHLYDVDLLQQ